MNQSWCVLTKRKQGYVLTKRAEDIFILSVKCVNWFSYNKWHPTCILTRLTASIKAALLGSRAVGVHLTGFYAGCRRVFSGNGAHSFLGLWNDNNNCTVKHGSRSARKHETSNHFFPYLLWKRSSRPRGVCKCCQISWHCEPHLRRLSGI